MRVGGARDARHRVLVTGVGEPAGRALAAQLVGRGVQVVGVDVRPVLARGLRTYQVPASSDARFLAELSRIITAQEVDIVLPTLSEELPVLAGSRSRLGEGVEVVVADKGSVLVAGDKLRTADTLLAAGVSVPQSGTPGDFAGAEDAFGWFGGPFVVKPRVSRGRRRGGVVVDTPHAPEISAEHWSALADTHIVQELAPGAEYAAAVYAAPGGDDKPDLVVVLEKAGLARGSAGNALVLERIDAPEVHDVASLALTAVRALGLVGPASVDVRRLADGRPVVLDVDARLAATTAMVPELLDRVLAGCCRPQAAVAVG